MLPLIFLSLFMEYTLCSSSEEEGQITSTSTFPNNLSTLSYCYYPNTQLFIGDNFIPRQSDFQDTTLITRIKKKLNKEVFDTLNLCRDKSFFDNKLTKICELSTEANNSDNNNSDINKLTIVDVIADYKEIVDFHVLKKGLDLYLDLFNRLIYQQNKENVILIKDSILTKINNKNVFVHFKILKNNNIIFEDSYYKIINVYDYLEMYYEEICKEYKSTEERWYKYRDYDLVIYSSTTYKSKNTVMRYFSGLDCDKNYLAVINKKNILIRRIQCANQTSLDFLEQIVNLQLEVGDYAHNQGEIFRIGLDGEQIPYEGIDYNLVN